MFSGDTAFKLYDTFGFPLDLTQDALKPRGITVDHRGLRRGDGGAAGARPEGLEGLGREGGPGESFNTGRQPRLGRVLRLRRALDAQPGEGWILVASDGRLDPCPAARGRATGSRSYKPRRPRSTAKGAGRRAIAGLIFHEGGEGRGGGRTRTHPVPLVTVHQRP